jgi:hypothetical protein
MSAAPVHPDIRRRLQERLFTLSPRAFELFAGELLVYMGLQNVSVTRYTGDGGIDAQGDLITGTGFIHIPAGIQVKRHKQNVRRPDIDRFIGALSGRFSEGIFVTTAAYASQALIKAAASIPHVSTIDGAQVVAIMIHHNLGLTPSTGDAPQIDENFFADFEAQTTLVQKRITENREHYDPNASDKTVEVQPQDDLISLRTLSYALRVDTTTIRRWIESGKLQPDQQLTLSDRQGFYFRRDRIDQIRQQFLRAASPEDSAEWRQEFLDFVKSRNLTKSYKPVLLKAILKLVNRNGEVAIDELVHEFRNFYIERQSRGLTVEFGVPLLQDPQAASDSKIRQLIIRYPLDRFLIKGFLEYLPDENLIRFAPQLWSELRFYEMIDVLESIDEQLRYYYERSR